MTTLAFPVSLIDSVTRSCRGVGGPEPLSQSRVRVVSIYTPLVRILESLILTRRMTGD